MTPDQPSTSQEEVAFWRRSRWWVHTGQASIAVLAGTALSFIATILVARSLEVAEFGAVLLATTTVGAVASFLDVSFEEAIVHHGAKAAASGDVSGLKALLRTSVRLDVLVGIIVFTVVMMGADILAQLVGGANLDPWLLRIASVEVLFLTVNGTSAATLLLAGRAHLRAWAMAWTGASRLAAVVVVTSFVQTPESVLWAYVAGSALGAAALAAVAIASARATWPDTQPGSLPVGKRPLFGFAFQSSLTTSIVALQTGIVAAILGRRSGPSEVAVYQVALFSVTVVAVATSPIRITSMAEQARLAAQGRIDVLRHSIRRFSWVALWIGGVGVVVGWFALDRLIPALYSARYAIAVGPARVLLIAALALFVTAWAKQLPMVLGRPGVRTAFTFGELLLTTGLVAMLASRGAEGAAIAVSAAYVVVASTWFLVSRRMLASATPSNV
jgi:O-antigen/teichoic acid export membrane protein